MTEVSQNLLPGAVAFRHDRRKNVLGAAAGIAAIRWRSEPVVAGYRALTYENKTLARTIAVPVSATPAVVTGVGVVLASDDGFVRLYDLELQKVYWEQRMNGSVYASVIVDHENRSVLVVSTSGLAASFDLKGDVRWSRDIGSPVCATPTITGKGSTVAIATFGSRCIGLDATTGDVRFDIGLPRPWGHAVGSPAAMRDAYASPSPTPSNGVIVACAEHVLCLDAAGGERWRYAIGSSVKSSPAVVEQTNQVAICAVDGSCSFIDLESGRLAGRLLLDAKVTASPAVSGDVLAVGTVRGDVMGIHLASHEVAWQRIDGAPRDYTSFTVLPTGEFVATGERGNAMCLDPMAGSFLWETSQVLGLPDHDPGMNVTPVISPDGRMYCASYGGLVYHFRFAHGEGDM